MTDNREIEVDVRARHEPVSDRMRDHAIRKVARLYRYNDRVTRIEIVAEHPHEAPEVEILVHLRRGAPLVARQRGLTFSAAVDALVEKMERQLKKQKEKLKDHKAGGRREAKPRGPADAEPTRRRRTDR